MAIFQGSIYSKLMEMDTGLTVFLPDCPHEQKSEYPVLYLLHGLEANNSCWLHRTQIERYAAEHDFIVIMPEVQRSFYTDMAYGLPYFTYISEELPKICQNLFPISKSTSNTFIAGFSMGGYGALKCGLRQPKKYGAVASFSGAVDIRSALENGTWSLSKEETFGIFGNRLNPENDIRQLTVKASKESTQLPFLYLTCGLSDPLRDSNLELKKQMEFLHIPHVYEEWAGGHDWFFWDKSIQQFIKMITK